MTKKVFNFTKRAIEAIAPTNTREQYSDSKTAGLFLRVTPTGTKSFSFYRRVNGKPERVTIGKFPTVTVDQARAEVAKLNAQVVQGISPADNKRAIQKEVTLGEIFDQYMERHAKVHKSTWAKDQQLFDTHLSHWANKKLSSIKQLDFQNLHTAIGNSQKTVLKKNKNGSHTQVRNGGKGAANHLLRMLRTVFNKAIDWGWEGRNPIIGIKEFQSQSRDRFLESNELPRLFESLMAEPNKTIRDFFLMCLLTGARKGNVEAMRWDQINFDSMTWRIPKTKTGDAQVIPLPTQAIELLSNSDQRDSPWVFPSSGKTGHLVSPRKAWLRILARAEITDSRGTTIHDLRRSLGSWQAATGANLSIISKTLNHKNISTTQIYARLGIDPVRSSMQTAVDAMWNAGGQSSSSETSNNSE
jgi:integrase